MPFAVVSDVVVAGIFSLINTVLSGILIHTLTRKVEPKVDETHRMLDRRNREGDPPTNGEHKRRTDQ